MVRGKSGSRCPSSVASLRRNRWALGSGSDQMGRQIQDSSPAVSLSGAAGKSAPDLADDLAWEVPGADERQMLVGATGRGSSTCFALPPWSASYALLSH